MRYQYAKRLLALTLALQLIIPCAFAQDGGCGDDVWDSTNNNVQSPITGSDIVTDTDGVISAGATNAGGSVSGSGTEINNDRKKMPSACCNGQFRHYLPNRHCEPATAGVAI